MLKAICIDQRTQGHCGRGRYARMVTGKAAGRRDLALERCQVSQAGACVDRNRPREWRRRRRQISNREMPRARYDGSFDMNFIPGLAAADRNRADVAGYDRAPPQGDGHRFHGKDRGRFGRGEPNRGGAAGARELRLGLLPLCRRRPGHSLAAASATATAGKFVGRGAVLCSGEKLRRQDRRRFRQGEAPQGDGDTPGLGTAVLLAGGQHARQCRATRSRIVRSEIQRDLRQSRHRRRAAHQGPVGRPTSQHAAADL